MVKQNELSFHNLIKSEVSDFLVINESLYPEKDVFKIDLHCHDHNSNVPDELLGRILNVPETWLPTDQLISTLKKHGMDAFTITNHNDARSCFELLDKGFDVLAGAEFSCTVPDHHIGIHVLTYGFSPEQEAKLNKLRKNIYAFLDYTLVNDLPTIWAHPLYHYKKAGNPSFDFFNKMALLFERFEVLNGQRDTWQNMLVKQWIEDMDEEKIFELSQKHGIEAGRYCRHPYKKNMSGGSDSHMGIFSGLTGTRLYVPNYEEERKTRKLSELALEAIKEGRMAAFGAHNNSEKMMITFLDYFCQITIHGKDPGLLRILLHKGETPDKITAFLIANTFAELRQHKVTMKFINLFHASLTGAQPHFTKRWLTPKIYKPIFDETKKIARTFQSNPEDAVATYSNSIGNIYNMLSNVLNERIAIKIENLKLDGNIEKLDLNKVLSNLEIPSEFRSYTVANKKNGKPGGNGKHSPDVASFLDGLPFPFLASGIILGAHFTSAHFLYNNRPLLNDFSQALGYLVHPKRMLWLTDTWDDNNGVSMVLKLMLEEIKKRNLPIDIMVCSSTLESEDHLIVIKPLSEMQIPFYKEQKIRIPNFLEIHHRFLEGEYDRVMCSTEGPMGLAALYLKHAYSVPAYFYMHTDWIVFAKKVLHLEKENQTSFRRLNRAYYKAFDGVFVLNTDHFNWLTNKKMELSKSSVFLTAHWAANHFHQLPQEKQRLFNIRDEKPVMLFAGRISHEKGVMELPDLYKAVKSAIPGIQMVIAGSGPAEKQLKEAMPDAIYFGWVDPVELPAIYSSADLLLLPSQFDTFSCVVLESLACGLPVVAYNTKGPKDIIQHEINGFLVSSPTEMINYAIRFFSNPEIPENMKKAAIKRSEDYTADRIIRKLLLDTGLKTLTGITV